MIFLFTGLPGSFKTCSAIQFAHERFVEKEKRRVFAYNVNALSLDGWEDIPEEKVKNWWELPKGSVLFIDEAQLLMPQRGTGRPPEWIERFSMHRHSDKFAPDSGALDIVIVTQDCMMIDVFVRRLVNEFRHNVRPVGLPYASVTQWGKVGDPEDYHFKKEALKTYRYRPDKRFYKAYSSTTVHTFKTDIPWKKLAVLGFFMGLVSVAAWGLFQIKERWENGSETAKKPSESTSVGSAGGGGFFGGVANRAAAAVVSPSDLASYVPRVAGLPHTAPRYDELTRPTSVPVPVACVRRLSRCTCYSQKGTRMQVDDTTCNAIIEDGYFLDFNPDAQVAENGAVEGSEVGAKGVAAAKPVEAPEGPLRAAMGGDQSGESGVRKFAY